MTRNNNCKFVCLQKEKKKKRKNNMLLNVTTCTCPAHNVMIIINILVILFF